MYNKLFKVELLSEQLYSICAKIDGYKVELHKKRTRPGCLSEPRSIFDLFILVIVRRLGIELVQIRNSNQLVH